MTTTLSLDERRAIFAVLVRMAWADGRLEPEEVSALRGALRTLALEPADVSRASDDVPRLSGILPATPAGRMAAFVAASWLAAVDGSIEEPELALLRALAPQLEIDELDAEALVREGAASCRTMSSTDRRVMNADRWSLDLSAVLAWTLEQRSTRPRSVGGAGSGRTAGHDHVDERAREIRAVRREARRFLAGDVRSDDVHRPSGERHLAGEALVEEDAERVGASPRGARGGSRGSSRGP